ncbi:unnamed protein product [Rotaria magnacalcarata]|uniref:F-box domain-containing protein n=2 Tax=Rotaria magnacalcarata TaxID=392030 RepID=A0A820DFU7_9BILA|nr:unnamed protein product [Rotaria magnacalcarata]
MNLESLCHELLLDVYLFLSTVHLFRAFRGLDARFNTLIFNHVRTYGHFDFRSASKQDCDIIYQQHLPTIIDQIISLRLSNDDATPQQIERFLSRGFTFCHFIQLQSLSLFSMYSPEIMMQMIDDLRHLPNLDHLNLVDCYLGESRLRYQLQNRLCRAPHLTSLKFRSWSILSAFLYEIKNQSIRRFDLQGTDRLYRELWLNGDECIQSGPSTLGIQCEVLFIRVKHRENNQLDESDGLSLARHDELVTWFEDQLSLAWEIAKHPRYFRCIQMWIR